MVDRNELELILPWDAGPVIAFFEKADRRYIYREQLIELIRESRHAFLANCPRASMIVAGEAVLRALFELVATSARLGHEASVNRPKHRGGMFTISPNMDTYQFFALQDELTFDNAISLLNDAGVLGGCLDHVYAVKTLRNKAAHGDLPLIDDWDPDEPRPDKTFLFDADFEFPEAYVITLDHAKGRMLNFDVRLHNCGSLKALGYQMRLAAIQYLTVMTILREINNLA